MTTWTYAVLLWAGCCLAPPSLAGENPATADIAEPIPVVWDTSIGGKVVVNAGGTLDTFQEGCDGLIVASSAKTGALLWQDDLSDEAEFSAFAAIATDGKLVVAVGTWSDDDGGSNVLVRCYKAKTGEVLWTRDFEHPQDPTRKIEAAQSNTGAADRVDLELVRRRVSLRVRYIVLDMGTPTGDVATISLLLDSKTGESIAPSPEA